MFVVQGEMVKMLIAVLEEQSRQKNGRGDCCLGLADYGALLLDQPASLPFHVPNWLDTKRCATLQRPQQVQHRRDVTIDRRNRDMDLHC